VDHETNAMDGRAKAIAGEHRTRLLQRAKGGLHPCEPVAQLTERSLQVDGRLAFSFRGGKLSIRKCCPLTNAAGVGG